MAISDDTAALVAAQLTSAWAHKTGAHTDEATPAESAVAAVYLRLRDAVRERDIPSGGYDLKKLVGQ